MVPGFKSQSFQITGQWDHPLSDQLFLSDLGERPLTVYLESFKIAGVVLWAERTESLVRITGQTYRPETGMVSVRMQPLSMSAVKAERWRRACFYVGIPFVRLWRRLTNSSARD